MNSYYRLKLTTLLALVVVLAISVTSCAGRQAYTRGNQAELSKNFETAMTEYKSALDREPGNSEYRLKYEQARYNASFQHFEAGRRAVDKQDYETAKKEFTRVLEMDPTHALAEQQLAKVNEILTSRNRNAPEPEIQFQQLKDETRTDPTPQAQLEPKTKGPIDVHMTQDSKVAFETLSELAGFNVIFDPDFRGTRVQIDLNRVDIFEALDIVSLQTRSFWKPVNKTTILISPDNQTKRRDYEELVLKTIYMTNSVTSTELTEAITTLRTLLNMRYLMSSTSMNAIIIRDTADRVAIAEKIIEDLDKAKPEVLVDAMILEVDRNALRQLGLLPPQGTSLSYNGTGATNTGSTTGTSATGATTTTTSTSTSIALSGLQGLTASNFSLTIPPAVVQFLASNSNTRLLQNPRVRASDGKLASIRIGSQVPIASGSFQPAFVGATGTPVVNFQFVDVGVNLDITPRVLLDHEISMTVMVQVRALAGDRNVGGVTQPVLTNRQVQHEIRLAEGETNVLGGIITDTEATSLNGIPGLKNIPILRYLFSQEQKSRDSTEIIIMLTPHILRMPNITATNMRGLYTGSETIPRLRTSPNVAAIGSTAPQGEATPAPRIPGTPPAGQPPAGGQPPAVAPVPAGTPATPPNTQPQAARQTNSTLAFSPSPVPIPPNGMATLNIIGNGTDFFGVDLTLSFEPGAIDIREIRDGGFLSRDGQIVAFVQRTETESGTLHISLERPPGSAPVSGTGNLVTLVLARGMRAGDSTIRITDFRVRDPQQNVATGQLAEVRVLAP